MTSLPGDRIMTSGGIEWFRVADNGVGGFCFVPLPRIEAQSGATPSASSDLEPKRVHESDPREQSAHPKDAGPRPSA